jgi:hypothetical protein
MAMQLELMAKQLEGEKTKAEISKIHAETADEYASAQERLSGIENLSNEELIRIAAGG